MNMVWPEIPLEAWQETYSALHLYTQVVGKYRLARTPWINHSWHATFYVNARGLTTSLIPDAAGIEIIFDLISHTVIGRQAMGAERKSRLSRSPLQIFMRGSAK